MKTKISFVVFFLSIVSFPLFCQNFDTEVKNLLLKGKTQFEVLDSVKMTTRQARLMYKFQIAYRENLDAFNVYFGKTGNNQKAKYPKNKFLSEKELLEYMDFAKNVKVLPTQTEIVEVIYSDDNTISFISDGKLAMLNLITYYAETNTFNFANNYTLTFVNAVNVETDDNGFGEAWKGYNWEFAEAKNIDLEEGKMPNLENINEISIKQYKITLGRLSSGRPFMIIKLKDFQEGSWITNVEIPIRVKY